MKKMFSIALSLALILSLCACTGEVKTQERFTSSFLDLFDTASTIIAYDDSQEAFDAHYERFYNELQRYDRLYDIYHSYDGLTNLYVVNKEAGKAPVKVDKEIIDMLEYGKEVYKISGGKTNICFGSVLKLWHIERELAKDQAGKLPNMDELKSANKHTNINDLIIDKEKSTVFFKDPQMQLDVGAIAKGYAVQKVVEYSKKNLWENAAVSIGGNVSTYGFKGDGKTKWKIGIENPDVTADDYLLMIDVSGMSVVTSGDYQRYFTVDGKKYCHIINPETLMPSEYYSGVSILCEDSALGDALSTTLFNLPIEKGKALIESLDGVEAVWVDKNFNKTFSSGFEKYIAE